MAAAVLTASLAFALSASDSLALPSIACSLVATALSISDLACSLPISATFEIACLPAVSFSVTSAGFCATKIATFAALAAAVTASLAFDLSDSESLALPSMAWILVATALSISSVAFDLIDAS